MIYETVVTTPVADTYQKHQFLDAQFRPDTETPRQYVWFDMPGHQAVIRYHSAIGENLQWDALDSPPAGTKVRFQVRAHVRTMYHESPLVNGVRRRVTEIDYQKNIEWLMARSSWIGWDLMEESVDMHPMMTTVKKPGCRFMLRTAHFQGIARIRSPEAFARALAFGVGNAKAFGLGCIFFSAFGSRN